MVPAAYYSSPHWLTKRQAAKRFWKNKCAVCGYDWKAHGGWLEVHHLPSGYQNLWQEDPLYHLRLLCEIHHPKGRLTLESIRLWRSSYRWAKRLRRIFGFAVKVVRRLCKQLQE